ncbi:MAG: hypothetical protein ACI8ZX_000603 [Planctomycetota bacterium]|jgi:hypothetical protein
MSDKKKRVVHSTKSKALTVNLNESIYGTIAEIGAGQEVARNFFRVGGASGTIAKAMSAYDMAFSDAIYGAELNKRYVSESRVRKMLTHEYNLLKTRLKGDKYKGRRFFSFANTITTLNYSRTNEPHGWIGVRYQLHEDAEPNEIILHVRIHDNNTILQQRVIGELGVNLIYGAYEYPDSPETIIKSLKDYLSTNHIEIDMIRFSGPDYHDVDNRLLSLLLVQLGFTDATIFGPDNQCLQPKDFLYKKDVLMVRGRFRPVTNVNQDILLNGLDKFNKEPEVDPMKIVVMSEMNLNTLYDDEKLSRKDFLDRADILCALGSYVMVSNFHEHAKLAQYLKRCRVRKIRMPIGVMNLIEIYGLKGENDLSVPVLKSFGELFSYDVKLYAYPYQPKKDSEIITAKTLRTTKRLESLHQHFLDNDYIVDIKNFNEENLQIFSRDVLKMIQSGEPGWEDQVPEYVVDMIKSKCLFDYPCDPAEHQLSE